MFDKMTFLSMQSALESSYGRYNWSIW